MWNKLKVKIKIVGSLVDRKFLFLIYELGN